jgi:hypothetical protein
MPKELGELRCRAFISIGSCRVKPLQRLCSLFESNERSRERYGIDIVIVDARRCRNWNRCDIALDRWVMLLIPVRKVGQNCICRRASPPAEPSCWRLNVITFLMRTVSAIRALAPAVRRKCYRSRTLYMAFGIRVHMRGRR